MFHGLNKWPGDLDVGGVWFLDFGKGKSLILVSWIITLSHIRLGIIAVTIQINLVAWFWHRVKKLKRSLHIGYVFPILEKKSYLRRKKKKFAGIFISIIFCEFSFKNMIFIPKFRCWWTKHTLGKGTLW